jgi:chaperonin cofactor prefoldin
MNANKVTDYGLKRQLEKYDKDSEFQRITFQPNIEDATKKLKELPDYKAKALDLNATKSDIETSLKKIMSELKGDDNDQKYFMYKNIVDIYFALESAYDSKFKLEEKLEAKENVVQVGSGDLQRTKDMRDELDSKNKTLNGINITLTNQNADLSSNIASLKGDIGRMQNQLVKCRDSLNRCLVENKGYKQQKK